MERRQLLREVQVLLVGGYIRAGEIDTPSVQLAAFHILSGSSFLLV